MKRVLIPLAVNTDNKGQVAYFARPTYLKALEDVGLVPMLVSCEFTDGQLKEAYDSCSGVMFMGGWDVDPKYYGQESHSETRINEPSRDVLEMKILDWVKEDKKPFLGICRGEQMLNVAWGGSLKQHLSDWVTEQHSCGSYSQLGEIKHRVEIDKESKLFEILGEDEIVVNSGHHQAVDKVGDGLRVAAKTKEGVTEAIEGEDPDWFLLGVQWHPEAEESEVSTRIFAALAQACAKLN